MRLDYKTSKVLLSSNILLLLYKRTEIVIIYITKIVILEYNLPQNPKTGKNLKGISFEQLYNPSNG